jgi:hypothetical protein
MKKILAGMILLGLLIANPAPAKEGVTPMLKMNTTYNFVFGYDFIPAAPFAGSSPEWALVWEGTIHGDVTGVIRWWVEFTPSDTPDVDGVIGSVGRWEIWDCEPVYPSLDCNFDNLIMAGYDAFGYVSPTVWAGKGIVAYANEQYAEWFGRRITDGGWVDFDTFPFYGEGPFVIYNRPSNKH